MDTNTTKIRMNCNCGPEKKMREVWGMRTRGWAKTEGPGARAQVVNRCSECGRKWATIVPIRRARPAQQEGATL